MRPGSVVALSPALDRLMRVREREEPVLVQAFVSQSPVEAFDECVLYRLAKSDEIETHAALVSPGVESFTLKLRSVVQDDPLRKSAGDCQSLQHRDHTITSQAHVLPVQLSQTSTVSTEFGMPYCAISVSSCSQSYGNSPRNSSLMSSRAEN